ncbi:LacI family DNA-binding transcriptional regulator [Amaricoccus solimangrovi]|uniref:Substrate-binding domain-containing protein n=1 Tax=Amaricoccus solimangrovi TaxID=2589815 RepID=A0A501WQE0_9RHOB|nr:LacI family DNA-binding transcriptional regulator [Amaricoccus solimangrovi]TPE51072.1 substrate-binding domain-containing protein [Amaricoccus solimangrovi]
MRSTVQDIAREAGVSTATVDRVLNERGGVRSRTREVVLETAQRLGYIAEGAPPRAAPPIRLAFVLPRGTNAFMAMLGRQIELQAAARPEVAVAIEAIEGFDPDTLSATLRDLRGRVQGVGVVALDHPKVREAIRLLSESGIPVVTIASDIPRVPREAYVGIDNRQAGRLAGYVLGRFLGGGGPRKVAMLAGSLSYRGHEEREMGFRHVLAEDFPALEIVALREMRDDRDRAYAEASTLLDRHPDLAGIYNIGAGNQGIARVLVERDRAKSVVFVAHDATDANRALLLNGTLDAIIDQNPRVEAREALNILTDAIRGTRSEPHPPRLQIIFRENLPET